MEMDLIVVCVSQAKHFYLGTSTPNSGLSQISKSPSVFRSPVTFSARKRRRYEPFGIVVPFVNVGVVIANVLKPSSAASYQ